MHAAVCALLTLNLLLYFSICAFASSAFSRADSFELLQINSD
jgi:hypothetical protein